MKHVFRVRVYSLALSAFVLLPGWIPSVASQSKSEFVEGLEARAKQGSIKHQLELGSVYLAGERVHQDLKKSAHWYEKAAKAGSPVAENQIGYFYQKGIGVKVNPERAAHWYQLSAASGLSWGKVNLAICYLKGLGVRKDGAMARQLLLEAVEKGEGLAAAYLGDMALFGVGGPKDSESAERWFETGVRLHDPVASYNLAYLYTASAKHSRDLQKGMELLRSSAGKGYVPGMVGLGALLLNHPELARNGSEASELLEHASAAGSWRASAILGVLARDGNGREKDTAVAFYYFHLARLQGGEPGAKLVASDLQALSKRLAPEVQSASAERAEAWFQKHQVSLPFVMGHQHPLDPLESAADEPAM